MKTWFTSTRSTWVKARSRASFIKATAAELFVDVDVVKRDIGGLLFKLEALREQQIAEAKAPQVKVVELTAQETEAAMALLQDPNLLERIVADITACGMVGEATNKLVGYLAATSRKLKDPLAIVIQSSSSAGKNVADGRDSRDDARRRPTLFQWDDRPIAVLLGQ